MAKIADGALYKFQTGDIVDADVAPQGGALNPIFETIRVALNDTDTRVDGVYTKAEVDAILVGITAGVMNDGSVTNAKLATDVKVGSLAALNTTNKSNVVAALNETFALASVAVPNTGGTIAGNITIAKNIATFILKSMGTDAASGLTGIELRDSANVLHWAMRSLVYPGLGPTTLDFVNGSGTSVFAIGQNGVKTKDATTDLNNITVAGSYWAGYTTPNVPTMDNYYVHHSNQTTDAGFALQTAYRATGSPVFVYVRTKDTGVWGAWRRIDSHDITVQLTSGTDLNSILTNGKYDVSNAVNKPSGSSDWIYLEVTVHSNGSSFATQRATELNVGQSPRVWVRARDSGTWGAWLPLHTTYITPSDTVILSAPTERGNYGTTLKTFKVKYAGKYRIKGEMKSSTGGTSGFADLRYGIASAGNMTPDNSGSFSTASATYVPFSIETAYVPENTTIVLYGLTGSEFMFVRNVTLCGSETVVNPNTAAAVVVD